MAGSTKVAPQPWSMHGGNDAVVTGDPQVNRYGRRSPVRAAAEVLALLRRCFADGWHGDLGYIGVTPRLADELRNEGVLTTDILNSGFRTQDGRTIVEVFFGKYLHTLVIDPRHTHGVGLYDTNGAMLRF
jgi:hypothetical protein